MKKKNRDTEMGRGWCFLTGLIIGFIACAMVGWNPFGTFPSSPFSPGAAKNTNTGIVIPDIGTLETVSTVGNIIRFVTNETALTQIVYVYRELSNYVTAAPAATGQTLETITFDVYKNHYTLPLSFPRWQAGVGISAPFGSAQGDSFGISVYGSYRFYDRLGVWIGSDFKSVQIGLNVLID